MPFADCFYLKMRIRFTMSSLLVIKPAQSTGALYLEDMSSSFFFIPRITTHPLFRSAFADSVFSQRSARHVQQFAHFAHNTKTQKCVTSSTMRECRPWSPWPWSTDINIPINTNSFIRLFLAAICAKNRNVSNSCRATK